MRSNRDAAAAENRSLAEQNLETKPELEEMRNELTSVESTVGSLMDTYTQYYEQFCECSLDVIKCCILIAFQLNS